MPALPIVIAISPADSPSELRRTLLEACGRAVKVTECVERTATKEPPSDGSIVATITWRGAGHVRLEVALRTANQTVEREIDFGPHDATEERWRTTGLVVGTLASVLARNELPSAGELPAAPEPEATAEPRAPEPERTPDRPLPSEPEARSTLLRPPHTHRRRAPPRSEVFVDASALLAPAIVGGAFRSGGELGGRWRPAGFPVEPAAAVAYSETISDYHGVESRFFDAFIGLAVTGKLGGPFSSTARGEGFVRWLEVSTNPSGSLGPTEKARVYGGARVGLDGVVRITDPFSAFVGAAGIFGAGSTDVSIRSSALGSVPALSYELRLGMSLGF